MAEIFLSIGSNIEPDVNLKKCACALQRTFSHPNWSPIYRSAAVGMVGDDFLNAVVLAHTDLPIHTIIALLKTIEHEHGRVRNANKFTSRTLDVDLLLYDDTVLNSEKLTLPRAEITTALHVLRPLADLVPNRKHPVLDKTYKTLLKDLERAQPEYENSLTLVNLKIEQ